MTLLSSKLSLLAFLASTLLFANARADLPQPLLHYNFSSGSVSGNTVKDVSGSDYNAELGGLAKVTPIPAASPRDGLNNTAAQMGASAANSGGSLRYSGKGLGKLKSFTITLWYRPDGQAATQGTRLFDFEGIASPFLLGFNSNAGHLALNEGKKTILRNSSNRPHINTADKWSFIAITFNGDAKVDNLVLYAYFDESFTSSTDHAWRGIDGLHPIAASSLDRTLWDFSGSKASLVFAANQVNARSLKGYVADIRLYASAEDNSAALDHVQLREIARLTNPEAKR